jgi:hypothetical protein
MDDAPWVKQIRQDNSNETSEEVPISRGWLDVGCVHCGA